MKKREFLGMLVAFHDDCSGASKKQETCRECPVYNLDGQRTYGNNSLCKELTDAWWYIEEAVRRVNN